MIGYVYGPTIVAAGTAAVYRLGPYIPVVLDAAQGFFIPGPPPPTPGGYAGYGAREFLNKLWEKLTNWRKDESSNSSCP